MDEKATIGDVWYKVNISPDVFTDKKASDKLVRRLHSIKQDRTVPSDFSTLVKTGREGQTRTACRELRIPEISF